MNAILSAIDYLVARGFCENAHNDGWYDRGRQTVRLCPDGCRINYWQGDTQPTRLVSYADIPAVIR